MRKGPVRSPRRAAWWLGGLLAAVTTLVLSLVSGPAAEARTAVDRNPVAGSWGVYKGEQDGAYPAWQRADRVHKRLFAEVALQPRMRWYIPFIKVRDIRRRVHNDIVQEQNGDPRVIVPMAMFRLFPEHEYNKDKPLTRADQRTYRRWVDGAARGIGRARVMMVLEPDLPVALKGWRPAVRLRLANYAARTFSALPHTTVYLDGGASDWLSVSQATQMLRAAGIRHVRGFALSGTHYTSTRSNLLHGRRIIGALDRAGIHNKHFVVDTSDNARPFMYRQYFQKHPNGHFYNAEVCQSKTERQCVTLGIPPTYHVAAARWHLPSRARIIARRWCDAYVWYNRPWLTNGTWPFDRYRTLQMARTTPYQ